ncbi:MAG: MFS transporter, partial [Nanoarchaeota archaeon]
MLNIPLEFIRQLSFVRNIRLVQLYLTISLATLSLSLIGLFIPIFLMKEIGYSFGSVMLFLIATAAFSLVTFPFALKLSSRIGMNRTAMLSVPIRVSFLLLLNALHFWHVPLVLIAFLSNLGAAMFWLPYHIRFAQTSDHDHRGTELGMRYLLEGLAAVSGPVLGGILVATVGFKWLYVIASFILALSVIPLFFMKDMRVGQGFRLMDVLKRKTHTDLIGYMAEGYRTNAYTLWSLFLFFFVGSYVTLGGISSLVSLANSVFQVFAGYVSDSFSKKGMLR